MARITVSGSVGPLVVITGSDGRHEFPVDGQTIVTSNDADTTLVLTYVPGAVLDDSTDTSSELTPEGGTQ